MMEAWWSDAGYISVLFILTGLAVLRFDVRPFTDRHMVREAAWARGIGWLNVAAGILLYTARWIHDRWWF